MLICQDLARGYHRRNISPRCLLKVDLQKAFDSVHWGFLKELLTALKFPHIFTDWILACVTIVHFTIHINGQDHGTFKGGRGLRQGDPLSPLLFVLTMEYFSRLMIRTSFQPGFSFHPYCKHIGLTHLMFADNLIIFSKAGPHSLQLILAALREFHDCAGLKANMDKSQIVLGGCPLLHAQCLQIMSLPESSFLVKYLGVPISANRLTKIECTGLVEKIIAKVHY